MKYICIYFSFEFYHKELSIRGSIPGYYTIWRKSLQSIKLSTRYRFTALKILMEWFIDHILLKYQMRSYNSFFSRPDINIFPSKSRTFLELSILFFFHLTATKKRTCGVYIRTDDPVISREFCAGVQEQ